MQAAARHDVGLVAKDASGRFLHVHQAQATLGTLSYPQDNGKTQTTERTASFYPISSIKHLHRGVVFARPEHGRELSNILLLEELFDRCSFSLFQRPKGITERNDRLDIFDALLG
jgi:hypothetical protein